MPMRLDATWTQAEYRDRLALEVANHWGAERVPALGPVMDTASGALWELARRPLGPTDEEPDFVGETA
jgi:hypothetical protein